ncbi:MAG: hypothetical protein ACLT1W_07330 [Alistipes onderdonkii]
MPTAGTIDALGNSRHRPQPIDRSSTNRKEFVLGLLPVDILSTMTVKVMTTDGLTYSDKSFTLAGLKRNHHYTMSVPCNKKTEDDHRARCHRPEVRYAYLSGQRILHGRFPIRPGRNFQ